MVRVVRHGKVNPKTANVSGDYISVDGIYLGECRVLAELEYQRAKLINPKQPTHAMRPMFNTGSEYADEILQLVKGE